MTHHPTKPQHVAHEAVSLLETVSELDCFVRSECWSLSGNLSLHSLALQQSRTLSGATRVHTHTSDGVDRRGGRGQVRPAPDRLSRPPEPL